MKKTRTIASLLSLIFILTIFTGSVCGVSSENTTPAGTEYTANIRGFFDSYVTGRSLLSDNIATAEVTVSADITPTLFSLNGNIWDIPINITAPISNGQISSMTDTLGNYDVWCLRQLDNAVRVIVSEKNTMDISYVDVSIPEFASAGIENYNLFWYTAFISPEILPVSSPAPAATTETEYLAFYNSSTVFDGVIREFIRIALIYEWDTTFSGTGDFAFTCGVAENYSLFIPNEGSSEIWDTSSLQLVYPTFRIATPAGDYIRTADTYFVGTSLEGARGIDINYSLTIPDTDFSIGYNLPHFAQLVDGRDGYYSFPASSGSKTTQANFCWNANYTCSNPSANGAGTVGDFFEIMVDIKYDDAYVTHGVNKSISTRWDFWIQGDNNCNGIHVDSVYDAGAKDYTLTYQTSAT